MVAARSRQSARSVHYPFTGARPPGANPVAFWMVLAGSTVAMTILFVAGVLLTVPI